MSPSISFIQLEKEETNAGGTAICQHLAIHTRRRRDFKTKKLIRMMEWARGNGISNVGLFIWAVGIGVRLNTILGNKKLYTYIL
jgi:hypothetical protein